MVVSYVCQKRITAACELPDIGAGTWLWSSARAAITLTAKPSSKPILSYLWVCLHMVCDAYVWVCMWKLEIDIGCFSFIICVYWGQVSCWIQSWLVLVNCRIHSSLFVCLFLCVWLFAYCLYMWTSCSPITCPSQKKLSDPGIGVMGSCEPPCGCWNLNPGPLQERVLKPSHHSSSLSSLYVVLEFWPPVFTLATQAFYPLSHLHRPSIDFSYQAWR